MVRVRRVAPPGDGDIVSWPALYLYRGPRCHAPALGYPHPTPPAEGVEAGLPTGWCTSWRASLVALHPGASSAWQCAHETSLRRPLASWHQLTLPSAELQP
jgi:hypothetical protein